MSQCFAESAILVEPFDQGFSLFNCAFDKPVLNIVLLVRSIRWMCSVRKGVLRNFAVFNFIEKEALAQVLSFGFCEISKNTFSYRTLPVAASVCYLYDFIHRVLAVHQMSLGYLQKQPPRGVPRKRCSENMQQIYRGTPMPKCDFNKVAKQLY